MWMMACAAGGASASLTLWRRTPANERAQWLYRLKDLLEHRIDDLARCMTEEHGKVFSEARGEVRRAIDNVEMACGAPANLQGRFAEDIASGVDEMLIRQPVGVCAAIVPFNFPLMIPCWFLPCQSAIVCSVIRSWPLNAERISAAELLFTHRPLELPAGVVTLLQGGLSTSEALIDHPDVRGCARGVVSSVARLAYYGAMPAPPPAGASGHKVVPRTRWSFCRMRRSTRWHPLRLRAPSAMLDSDVSPAGQ